MKRALFITGANGFIGKNLLGRLEFTKYERIICLTRSPNVLTADFSAIKNLDIVKSNILNPEKYGDALKNCDVVVHFAAATGKQNPEDYFKVNAEGTQLLVDSCKQFGVRNFLYISSISTKFEDKNRYYYAQSKLQGEEIVKQSGLSYVIVRPTQVIGHGGSLWENFSRLAKAPIIFMFGDGQAKIQPIYTDDLVDCLIEIINEDKFANETIDLGGREVITIEDFIRRIHHFYTDKDAKVIHLPLKLIIPILSFLERFVYGILPVTVGQLAAFRNDGTIIENRILKDFLPRMKNVDGIIRLSASVAQD
jgi:nucleoside-diphosphate-sugar epimerase